MTLKGELYHLYSDIHVLNVNCHEIKRFYVSRFCSSKILVQHFVCFIVKDIEEGIGTILKQTTQQNKHRSLLWLLLYVFFWSHFMFGYLLSTLCFLSLFTVSFKREQFLGQSHQFHHHYLCTAKHSTVLFKRPHLDFDSGRLLKTNSA